MMTNKWGKKLIWMKWNESEFRRNEQSENQHTEVVGPNDVANTTQPFQFLFTDCRCPARGAESALLQALNKSDHSLIVNIWFISTCQTQICGYKLSTHTHTHTHTHTCLLIIITAKCRLAMNSRTELKLLQRTSTKVSNHLWLNMPREVLQHEQLGDETLFSYGR